MKTVLETQVTSTTTVDNIQQGYAEANADILCEYKRLLKNVNLDIALTLLMVALAVSGGYYVLSTEVSGWLAWIAVSLAWFGVGFVPMVIGSLRGGFTLRRKIILEISSVIYARSLSTGLLQN